MKRILFSSIILFLSIITFAMPVNATIDLTTAQNAITPASISTLGSTIDIQTIYSGGCGNDDDTTTSSNVVWSLDTDTGVLTISGVGNMKNYTSSNTTFGGYSSIKSVIIEPGVTSIGDFAFYQKSNITSISIPNSVTSIGELAFKDCDSLTAMSIPEGVTSIGDSAFYGCSTLSSITIPSSISFIGYDAFKSTPWLTAQQNDSTNGIVIVNHIVVDGTIATGVTIIPDDVTAICESAFKDCKGITSVTIPDNVISIGDYAFMECTGLKTISIGKNVRYIGTCAFQDCSTLTPLVLPNALTTIGSFAFLNCSAITSLTIPESVTSIGGFAFSGLVNLTIIQWDATSIPDFSSTSKVFQRAGKTSGGITVTIGDNVTNIPAYLFYTADYYYLPAITSLTIGNSVKTIGNYAFYGQEQLTSLTIPDSVTTIGDYAFYDASLITTLTIGENVDSIGSRAFSHLYKLSTIYWNAINMTTVSQDSFLSVGSSRNGFTLIFGNEVTSIPKNAFYDPTPGTSDYAPIISSLTMGENVTTIGEYAFFNALRVSSLTIPNSVVTIDGAAFCGNYINVLTLGENVTSMGNSAFAGCQMGSINWNATNVKDTAGNPNTFYTNYGGSTTLTVGDNVQHIPAYAFYGCTSLTSIIIGKNVTSIGDYAFYLLRYLSTSVTIPFKTSNIGINNFKACASDFSLRGYTGSYAETYASQNSITYYSLGYQYFSITYYDDETKLALKPEKYAYTIGASALPTPTKTDYIFVGWYDNPAFTGDKIISVASTQTGDITLYAKWMPLNCILTTSAGKGGSISPETTTVSNGGSQTFTISPENGYVIDDVSIDGVSQGAITSYTFSNVTDHHTINATFKPTSYTITIHADSGGSISPTSASVNSGSNQSFTITPNSGYTIQDVVVDGVSQGAISSYTFSNVKETHSIYATFKPQTYMITVNAGNNGSISPGSTMVDYGGNQTFTITPNSGYVINNVTVDGVSQGAINFYAFTNVTGAHTITATFKLPTYTITANPGEGGSINPASATVNQGSSLTFTITPNTGYEIKDVIVDGISQGAVSSYTFHNVTAGHTIAATFKQKTTLTFTDVPIDCWYEKYVNDLVSRGILSGYKNDDNSYSFQPDNTITRAEFATILAKASGEDLTSYVNKTSFNDVSATYWGAKFIEWAFQNHIVSGVGSGKYDPEANITRQEMAVMIYRFATEYQKEKLPQKNAALTFTDNGFIASWAATAVSAMQQAGVINGIKNDNGSYRFEPESSAQRSAAATMISIYLGLLI